jgi:hypothetical protein
MEINWKILAVIVVMVFIAFVCYTWKNPKLVNTTSEKETIEATGSVDDMINALTLYSDNEKTLTNNENNDETTIKADSAEINSYLNSYDEKDF